MVWIPAGEKHWHGATATTAMTHIAIQEQLDGAAWNGWNMSVRSNIEQEIKHAHWITNSVFKYPGPAAIRQTERDRHDRRRRRFYVASGSWIISIKSKGMFGEAYTDPMMESYTTLGYFAGLTEKIFLGTLVTGVIYRHPSVLMKMVNTWIFWPAAAHISALARRGMKMRPSATAFLPVNVRAL